MFENIGLLSLMSGASSPLAGLQSGSVKGLESGSENNFNRLFYNNLSGDSSERVELVSSAVSPLSAATIGTQMAAALSHNFNSLEPELELPQDLLQGGSQLPVSGKSLPALASQVEALGGFAEAALQKLTIEPELAGDSVFADIESALRNVVVQLDELATTLNAAVAELPDTQTSITALNNALGAAHELPPALQPYNGSLQGEMDSVIDSVIDSTVAALQALTVTLNPASVTPVGAGLSDKQLSENALPSTSTEKAGEAGRAVASVAEASTSSASGLLRVILQRVETITSTIEQAITAPGNGVKASFVAASTPMANAMLRSPFAAKVAEQIPAFAQEPLLPVQSNALNALASAATHGAALSNVVHAEVLPSATLPHAAVSNPVAATQLPAALSSTAGHAVVEQPFTTHVGLPLDNSRWGDQFAQRVAWLAGQGLQSAQIHLNPAELGPLQVRIDSHEDSAKVVFTTTHVSTRDNIETNLPRLRDLFAAQGLDLLDVDVEQHNPQSEGESTAENGLTEQQGETPDAQLQALNAAELDAAEQHIVQLHYGLIDAFA
jgi:flagellar hook-length control protein FliK